MPILAKNKRASYDYEILETFEAGLVLEGHEVKSIRNGGMKLQGAFVKIREGSAWLVGGNVPRYTKAGMLSEYDPERTRKLLLKKRELGRILSKLETKGLTLVPISVYTKESKIKLEFGIGKGKRQYQKKETIKRRDINRDVNRLLKGV